MEKELKIKIENLRKYTTKEERIETYKINQKHIYRLKEEIQEMLKIMRTGNFADKEQADNFANRLTKKNLQLSFFEQENKALSQA